MIATKHVKNVIFDVGNVLIDFCWHDHMVNLGFSKEAIDVLTKNMIKSPLWVELDRGALPADEVVEAIKAASPDYVREINAYFDEPQGMIRVMDYSADWLKSLKERGCGVYLLSNYPRFLFEQHIERYTFLPYTDGRIVSGFVGAIKPDEKIYHILLDKYSLDPADCCFIDDRQDNTDVAKSIGMEAIVFKSYPQASAELEKWLING